jgi:NAD(P)-dependent dehydrogenase (short-subunit alcohol dehydrogenase family)
VHAAAGLVDKAVRHFGTIDLLDEQLATNVRSPYRASLRAFEIMKPLRQGSIIHISSVGGLRAHTPGLPCDHAKGAVDAMTRAMALDCAPHGIRVNAVAPGATIGPEDYEVPAGRRSAEERAPRRLAPVLLPRYARPHAPQRSLRP